MTYCEAEISPTKLWRTAIHEPMPARSIPAAFSSSASSEGDRLHSIRSTPVLRPTIEYVKVETSDRAFAAAANCSAERHLSSRSSRLQAWSRPIASAWT